jgi:hypothetical protein
MDTIASPVETIWSTRMHMIRGDRSRQPDGSIVIPVNAQSDLERVWVVINDLLAYHGRHTFEIIVMVNNYPADSPPSLTAFEQAGIRVVSQPDVRRPGIRVAVTARVHGTRVAASRLTIHFDADCRVPDPTTLLDWYVQQFAAGARAAYTPVNFCDLNNDSATQARVVIHHLTRWFKRQVLGIPTIRGSNFAIDRDSSSCSMPGISPPISALVRSCGRAACGWHMATRRAWRCLRLDDTSSADGANWRVICSTGYGTTCVCCGCAPA